MAEVEIVAHAGTLATDDEQIGSADANEDALNKDTGKVPFIGEFAGASDVERRAVNDAINVMDEKPAGPCAARTVRRSSKATPVDCAQANAVWWRDPSTV